MSVYNLIRGRRITMFVLLAISLSMVAGFVAMPPTAGASGVDLDNFYDNFDDNSINGTLWVAGSFEGYDPQVTVTEAESRLIITPRAGQTGLHYNGLMSNRTYNLTQGSIFVEAAEVAPSQINVRLAFGADNSNKAMMESGNGSLHMSLTIGGTRVGTVSIPYDASAHRWWRIRHAASDDSVRFDTSPDGITWTQRHSIARGSLNITTGKVNLSAGTWTSQSAVSRAVFDNLSWHPLVPNEGDWSTPVTAIAPNPTAGTWDHILWGAASPSTMVKFNGTYFLYYIGAAGDTGDPEYNPIRRSLGVATSSNGVNFTKFGSNPILTYTTSGGTIPEEGVGGATAIVVGNTIHLYYAAIRSTGGQVVDLDIRYRKSTDGYNFTNDTLIYSSPGDEYAPLGVTYDGSTWSVYIKGPLTNGKGALSRLSGTSPLSLPNKTTVTSTTFGSGGNANPINDSVFILHLDRRETTEDRFQVRVINKGSPNVLSEPLFSYTFGNFADHATPATFKDDSTGKWFMYTLDLSVEPAVISVRTYTPSQVVVAPTSTSMTTPTKTTTPMATSTNTPVPLVTSTPIPAFTPTTAAGAGIHIGDIDGTAEMFGNNWRAAVVIAVHDGNHRPVANATVEGNWSNGYSGAGSCITDATGSCTITVRKVAGGSSAVTFTVGRVSHSSLPYQATSNHDPDGDSNGSIITIQRP